MRDRAHRTTFVYENDPVPYDDPDAVTAGGPLSTTDTQGKLFWRRVRLGLIIAVMVLILIFILT